MSFAIRFFLQLILSIISFGILGQYFVYSFTGSYERIDLSQKKKFDTYSIKAYNSFENLDFFGEPIMGLTWTDARGKNVVLESQTFIDQNDSTSGILYLTHFLFKKNKFIVFQSYTFTEMNCEFDLTVAFLGDIYITDLNQDHLGEVSFVHRWACRSDASDAMMKVVIMDGKNSYCLEGMQMIVYSPSEIDENMEFDLSRLNAQPNDWHLIRGRYTNAVQFEYLPKNYLLHAKSLWKMHVYDTYF